MGKKQCEAGETVYVNTGEEFDWVTTKHDAGHIHVKQDHPLDSDDYDVVKGSPKPASVKGKPGEYLYSFVSKDAKLDNPKIIIS